VPVKRPTALLLLAACLEPGASLYDRADTTPPRVLFELSDPRILGGDAGVPNVAPAQVIKLVFSEPMDPESLRPGIVVRINPERNEIPLIIQAPPTAGATYEVRILPAEGTYRDATYTMQLRTLLIDVAGNPIADGPELTGFFRVQ
jgi:hypothetical protein